MRWNAAAGTSLTARILRSSALTISGFGASQAIRLLSNLLLTRLLYPEAFGLMGLVTVFMIGLAMFSDVGIGPAISRSTRGDEPEFLNTAWTIQIIRGIILFLAGAALAKPASVFYGEPELFELLLLASTQFLIFGLMPTRRETANRHLIIGRLTLLDLVAQVVGLVIMAALALWLRSVLALVLGSLAITVMQVALSTLFLPGAANRLSWDGSAAHELIHFGKWIFLSTICGFLLNQGDRLILGKYLALEAFGIYNIAYFVGSFPMMLGIVAITRLLIPIYRERPPGASPENFRRVRMMRVLVTGGLMTLLALLAFSGVWLIELLYDSRYYGAGAIVVLVACTQIPVVIGLTYDQSALAAGDSRGFFILSATKAAFLLSGLLVGLQMAGLLGALIGQGVAHLAAYPVLVWLARRSGAWDALHDASFAIAGIAVATVAIWWNWEALASLAT